MKLSEKDEKFGKKGKNEIFQTNEILEKKK